MAEIAGKHDFLKDAELDRELSPQEYERAKNKDWVERNFSYHTPGCATSEKIASMRRHFKSLAEDILAMSPDGRERALALTKLEEGMFWVNASLARP